MSHTLGELAPTIALQYRAGRAIKLLQDPIMEKSTMNRWFFLAIAAISSGLASPVATSRIACADPVPKDTCVIDLQLPARATTSVDGRDYGEKRRLEYNGLEAGKTYAVQLVVKVPEADPVQRRVLIQAGARVTLAIPAPGTVAPPTELQLGHPEGLSALAFSPDGRQLLGASLDRTASLWDVASGKRLRTLRGHAEMVLSVAFSPDGRQALTAGVDKAILWDLATGKQIRPILSHSIGVSSAAFSPDGRQILTTSWDQTAILSDAATGQQLRIFRGHTAGIWAGAFSPDGRQILTGADDKTAILWDAQTGTIVRALEGHKYGVHAVAFSPDGKQLLTAGIRFGVGGEKHLGELLLWDAATGRRLRTLENQSGGINAASFSPDGKQAICDFMQADGGQTIGGILRFDLDTGKRVQVFGESDSYCGRPAWSPDGKQIACNSEQHLFSIFDPASGKPIREFGEPLGWLRNVALSSDPQQVFVLDDRLALWDLASGRTIRQYAEDQPSYSCLAVRPDGKQAILASQDRGQTTFNLEWWDVDTAKKLRSIEAHKSGLREILFSPDGRFLATSSFDGTAALWDPASGTLLHRWEMRLGPRSIAFAPDGGALLIANWDEAAFRSTSSYDKGRALEGAAGDLDYVTVSPDGRLAAGAANKFGSPPEIIFWDTATGRKVRTLKGHTRNISALVFSPDSRWLLTGSDDRSMILWDAASGANLQVLQAQSGAIKNMVFLPGPPRVLAASDDGGLRLWDLLTAEELASVWRLSRDRGFLAITPQGLYEGSEKLLSSVTYRLGEGLAVEQVPGLKQKFLHPGLLAELAQGKRPLPAKEMAKTATPLVKILSPQAGQTLPTDRVTVEVEASDQGTGVGRLSVRHNGTPVAETARPETKGATTRERFVLTLTEGENRVEAVASTADGAWLSDPVVLVLKYEPAHKRPAPQPVVAPASDKPEMVLQTGHAAQTTGVAWSPDAKYVATVSDDGAAIVWEAGSGRQLHTLRGHTKKVRCVAFSPDSRYLLTGAEDYKAILWETVTGQMVRTLADSFYVVALAFSPDGRFVLTGTLQKATLWERETGQPLRTFAHPGDLRCLAFSPDGAQLVTGGGEYDQPSPLVLWETATGKELGTFQGHASTVCAVAFSPDGRQLLTGSQDDTARLWDVTSQKQIRLLQQQADARAVAFSRDGRQVFTAEKNLTIAWDPQSGAATTTFQGQMGEINTIVASPDDQQLLAGGGSSSQVAIIWDRQSRRQVQAFHGFSKGVCAVAATQDRRVLMTASSDSGRPGDLVLWDTTTGERSRVLQLGDAQVSWATLSPDGRRLLALLNDQQVLIWDTATGTQLQSIRLADEWIYSAALSADGQHVLTAGGKSDGPGLVRLWDIKTGAKTLEFKAHAQSSMRAAISPDGQQILTAASFGEENKAAVLWNAATGAMIRKLSTPNSVYSTAFSPDSRHIAIGYLYATDLFDTASGEKTRTLTGSAGFVTSLAFTPDGKRLLTACVNDDPTLTLWDVANGEKLHAFRGHTSGVHSLAITADGRYALSASVDGTARIWKMESGEELARLIDLDEGKDWLVVTNDGLFDGSFAGRQLVSWRIPGQRQLVPVDRFFNDFYRAGLLPMVFGNQPVKAEVKLGRSLPPLVKIVSPQSGKADRSQVTIEAEAVDQGGGVARLAIYHNGARVLATGETRREGQVVHRSFEVGLVQGANQFRVTATNLDGSWEAEPAELALDYEEPLAKSCLYLVAIGVSRYADANLSLSFAAKDAEALAEVFRRRGQSLYHKIEVASLLDDQATRDNIKTSLKSVASATRPQDTLMIFLAGHGTMVGQRYYFVPYELRKRAARVEDDIRQQGIPADELSDYLGSAKALKRVLILDTCASGGALAAATKGRAGFALRGAIERLSRTQGVFTIAAAAATEEAQEAKELGHGVLSYALLAGLKAVDAGPLADQYAQPSGPERVVDIMEWFTFAAGQVPRLTEKYYGVSQDVQTSTQGASFPVLPLEQ
jgi:WD40 repeat protein